MHVEGDRVVSCFWEGRPPCRPLPVRESPTELSALGTSRIYFYVISKVSTVDAEVDPPQQNSRPIRLREVAPKLMMMVWNGTDIKC